MKKKGLIIATIVMVLVLAVSLTTATYAWFTAESKATIASISIGTANASDVQVGLKTNRTTAWNSVTSDDYMSGTVTFNGLAITDGTNGFGPSIETGISLAGLSAAIGTGTIASPAYNYVKNDPEDSSLQSPIDQATFDGLNEENQAKYHINYLHSADSSWNASNTIIKANGTSTVSSGVVSTTADPSTIVAAKANTYVEDSATKDGDYIDWIIGLSPTKDNINSITLNITVAPNSDKTTLGLLAALHLRFSIDGTTYNDVDLYGTNNTQATRLTSVADPSYASSITGVSVDSTTTATTVGALVNSTLSLTGENAISDSTAVAAGGINYAITLTPTGTNFTAYSIQQISFQLFFAGYDVDCINAGLGTGANIYFTVTNTVSA